MKIRLLRFNIILLLICSCIVSVGCNTPKKDEKVTAAKKKHKKEKVMLQFHLAGRPVPGGRNIKLSNGMEVSVDASPFLHFRSIAGAQLLEDQFGYAIQIQFDSHGAFVLDTVTTEHRGKNIAIGATEAGVEQKWLGAPIIHGRNASGYLTFTPDVSREEAERIVYGIRNVLKEMKRLETF